MEKQFERNESRRFAAEARAYDRLDKQLADADALVGELVSGEFYINLRSKAGKLTGAIRRFKSKSEARLFLVRNKYV